jgi:hypothetical protein
MKRGPALLFVFSAGVLATVAILMMRGGSAPVHAGQSFVPGLADRASTIGAVEVLRANATIRLERSPDGAWSITTNDGYPVHTELVRALIVSLGSLELHEPMTTKPDRHGELGLAWPDALGRARRVRLLPAQPGGAAIADVVLGEERAQPDTIFVRTFDQPETWRARGRVQLPGDALGWIDRSLLALPDAELISASIRGLTLTRPAEAPAAGGPPPAWSSAVAPDATWSESQIQSAQTGLAPFLQRLELEGVRRIRAQALPEPLYSPVFEAQGATIRVNGHKESDGVWFSLEVLPRPGVPVADQSNSGRGDPFVPDYTALAQRVDGWEFRMPSWKAEALERTASASASSIQFPNRPPVGVTEEPNK